MLVFGIGYALASLSCTFGVILAVIAQAQATASYAGLLLVFGVYAAGSASILLLLALATTAAGTGLTRHVARLGSYGPRITGAVLLLTGVYLAWYWWPAATADNNLVATGRAGGVARLSTTLSGWVQAHTAPIAALAVIIIVVTGLTLAFGDLSGGFRRLIQIVFGLSIAFAASSFFLSFFSFGGGALV